MSYLLINVISDECIMRRHKSLFLLEWEHGPIHCSTPGLHLCGGHTKGRHRGGHYYHNGKLHV